MVEYDGTILALKSEMNEAELFPVDCQCLLYNSKLMNDVPALLDCDTRYGSTVHMILDLRDQMPYSHNYLYGLCDSLAGMRHHQFLWYSTGTRAVCLQGTDGRI